MLDTYRVTFSRLRPDKNRNTWPTQTLHFSPYKPLLLLSVLDQFASGAVYANMIEPSADLIDLFLLYCFRVLPPSHRSNMVLPFFFLKSQGFWHLIPRIAGAVVVNPNGSLSRLREQIYGARLDDALYSLVLSQPTRDVLRQVLIETYFASEVQAALWDQSVVNKEAFLYSQGLFRQAKDKRVKETLPHPNAYRPAARDQGFRRAVIGAYDHTCALCGLRVLTPEGHTAADAAHIVPWSQTHNDAIENGLALCKLCHWIFDEGLVSASPKYKVLVSPLLFTADNVPAPFSLLTDQDMTLPSEEEFWPDLLAIEWHRREVYRIR